MANIAVTPASPFSLFDADLPLLAVDAASEIDSIIEQNSASSGNIDALRYTTELLDRLVSISSNQAEINVDSIMYEQSFLPSIGGEKSMFQRPITLKERLAELVSQHSDLGNTDAETFYSALRDFFLDVSKFASASRRMLRIGNNPYPNASM